MEQHKDELSAAGLQVVGLGIGQPKHAARYCGLHAPHLLCLSTEGDAHRAYGVEHGNVAQLVGPQVIGAAVGALRRGSTQTEVTGDGQMLGATFIVDYQGIIRYARYDRFAGDHPTFDELLAAAQAIE